MFLDILIRRNPGFIEAAQALHQQGAIPPNSYVLDLDAVERNARYFATEAGKLGLKPESLSRAFNRLKEYGVEIVRDNAIIHDINRLANLVETERAEILKAKGN